MRKLTNPGCDPQCTSDAISCSNESVIGICWRESWVMLCVRGYRGGWGGRDRDRGAEREENDRRITAAVISFVRNMQHVSVIFGGITFTCMWICGFPLPCRLTLILSCPMDLKNFPMDVQTCTMQLESCECCVPSFLRPWLRPRAADLNAFVSLFTSSWLHHE